MEKKQLTSYNQYIKRKWLVLLTMLALLGVSAVLSLSAGSANLSMGDILRTLFGGGNRQENAIIWNVRMAKIPKQASRLNPESRNRERLHLPGGHRKKQNTVRPELK